MSWSDGDDDDSGEDSENESTDHASDEEDDGAPPMPLATSTLYITLARYPSPTLD